jgi:MYXO-CTERM domain-containing protein
MAPAAKVLMHSGTLTSLIQLGDSFRGSTVNNLNLAWSGLDGGNLAFEYHLASGVCEIAVANVAAAVPELTFLSLLSLAAVSLLRRRRR